MTNEPVLCAACALAVVHIPCGFCSKPTYYCSDRSVPGFYKEVDADDACTLGIPGDPMVGVESIDVTISDRACVDGRQLD